MIFVVEGTFRIWHHQSNWCRGDSAEDMVCWSISHLWWSLHFMLWPAYCHKIHTIISSCVNTGIKFTPRRNGGSEINSLTLALAKDQRMKHVQISYLTECLTEWLIECIFDWGSELTRTRIRNRKLYFTRQERRERFFSPGSTFCADSYFGIRSTPVLSQ